ncbi:MAG: hypothetical protein AVDCRST_MAG01-01-3880, partial [uncultured Rubrobacteraceae bacterium]
ASEDSFGDLRGVCSRSALRSDRESVSLGADQRDHRRREQQGDGRRQRQV